MRPLFLLLAVSWTGLWFTPDQRGQRLANRKQYAEAAAAFTDPMRQGAAWYRGGEFEKAEQAFARVASPEAFYNQGNSWVMLGKYQLAVASYEKAIALRPNWAEAKDNRDLAAARAKLLEQEGGDLGDQREGADEIVFDKNKTQDGQETVVAGDRATSDATIQAMWLRNVQTNPADFLKAKFAYQQANDELGGAP
jgi:Ca-activated chloride channel homolog